MSDPDSNRPLRIGLCGIGTVGHATLRQLRGQAELLARRSGRRLVVTALGMRRDKPGVEPGEARVHRDVLDVARSDDVDVVVELIGGTDDAHTLVRTALEQGKHVVTANKALIAAHGAELARLAEERDRRLCFEAAVAGGIPILQALRDGLAANAIESLVGIINGTTNFMLTELEASGRPYEEVLADAQRLGYAEADPSFDVGGIDAAQKLGIAAAIAFGAPLPGPGGVYTEGIEQLTPADTAFAKELGFRIKHLAIGHRRATGVELRVHPVLLPLEHNLARVDGVTNAIVVRGNAVGETMFIGPGAGGGPTASSVIADVIAIARVDGPGGGAAPELSGLAQPSFGMPVDRLGAPELLPMGEVFGAVYLRLKVRDEPGMLAAVAQALARHGVSLDAVLQRAPEPESAAAAVAGEGIPLVLLTHRVREAQVDLALAELVQLPGVLDDIVRIRVVEADAETGVHAGAV